MSKDESIKFMKQQQILRSSVNCPGPCINGKRTASCGKPMELKKTNAVKISTCGGVDESIRLKAKLRTM